MRTHTDKSILANRAARPRASLSAGVSMIRMVFVFRSDGGFFGLPVLIAFIYP